MAYTLDDLKSDTNKKFAAFEVDGFTLSNLVRLPKENRVKVAELLDELFPDDEKDSKGKKKEALSDEKALEIIFEIFRLAADNQEALETFLGQIGDDVVLAMTLLDKWIEVTGVGEASGSQK